MTYSIEDVKERLELEDIVTLLDYFGAEPELRGDYIVARTICHDGDSRKLYYYENDGYGLFQCYTHCGAFDVFELVQKVKHLDDLNAAVYFVVNFLNLQNELEEIDETELTDDWKYFRQQEKIRQEEAGQQTQQELLLPEFNLDIIEHYPQPRYLNWERDNIKKEVCDFCQIHYDPVKGNILIPHFDVNNRCVGIRQRTLIQEDEKYGKYRPWKNNGTLYNHPLAFNLYGFNWAKGNIIDNQIAIVAESEKSVLEYISYFGLKNNICVAVCGSSLSKYQFELLRSCGVKEIVIAFDKDFQDINSKEREEVEEKLLKIYKKFGNLVNMSFLFDKENILGYKSSPLDEGKDKFLYLFRNRIVL